MMHPLQNDLKDIYGVIFSDKPSVENADMKNVTIFADRQIDRSPSGTGTSVRVATLYAWGQLDKGEIFSHESITNGVFQGEVIANTKVESIRCRCSEGCRYCTDYRVPSVCGEF